MKILMIGAGRDVKGGVTTVVNNYYKAWNDDYELTYIESMKDGSKLLKLMIFFKAYLEALFKMSKTDIVHIHMASDNSFFRKYYFIKLAKYYHKKVIIHLHGAEFMTFYNKRSSDQTRQKIRDTFDSADHIIALSEGWKKNIATFSNTDSTVIYNAVELPEKLNQNKNNNICFLGRIGERKGIFDLLKVVVKLNKKHNDYKLIIGGDGEIDRLEDFIKENNLTNVEYVGWINGEEKMKLLSECGYFALPSYNEGLPMSLLEAMSYGCIPFTTDVGGIPEVIESGYNGYIAKAGDTETLYKQMDEEFSDRKKVLDISVNAYNTIKNEYSLKESLIKLYSVYDKLYNID